MLQEQLANQAEFCENPIHHGQQCVRLIDRVEARRVDKRFALAIDVLEKLDKLADRIRGICLGRGRAVRFRLFSLPPV